jgi:hypothetical protein
MVDDAQAYEAQQERDALERQHDARVTELITANNVMLERARAAEARADGLLQAILSATAFMAKMAAEITRLSKEDAPLAGT